MIKMEVHQFIPINCCTKLRWKKTSELNLSTWRDLTNTELSEKYQVAKDIGNIIKSNSRIKNTQNHVRCCFVINK